MKSTVKTQLKKIRSETERERWEEDLVSTVNEVHSQVSAEGGILTSLINKTGADSVKGSVIRASLSYDNAFTLQEAEYESIGVVYDDGIPDGSYCRVVIAGIAQVLLKDGTAATRGYWAKNADTDGRAEVTTAPTGIGALSTSEHFKEIGHCLESKSSGTDVLCKILLHFN